MTRRPIVMSKLIEFLVRNPEGLRLKDLMRLIGVSKKAVYESIRKLKEQGEIEHSPYGKYKLTRDAWKKYDLQLKKKTVEKIKLGFEPKSGLAIDKQIEEKKLSIVTLYSEKVIPKLANYTESLLKDLEERISEHYEHIKESTEDLQMVVLVTLA